MHIGLCEASRIKGTKIRNSKNSRTKDFSDTARKYISLDK